MSLINQKKMLMCKNCEKEHTELFSGELIVWNGRVQKGINFKSICAGCSMKLLMSYASKTDLKIDAIYNSLVSSLGRTRPTWNTVKNTSLWKKISVKLNEQEKEMIKDRWIKMFGGV